MNGARPHPALLAVVALAALAAGAHALALTPLLARHGAAAGERYGAALAGPGDVDGDGLADLLAGAPDADGARGRVELLRGSAALDTLPARVLTGEAPGDRFGHALAALGDLDGDGWRDWAVGAPAWVLEGAPGDSLGSCLAGGGDLDGDGFPDLAAGAPGLSGAAGRVRVWRGGASLGGVSDLVMTGPPGVGTGRSVAIGCDFDGDGFADLAYGEPGWRGTAGSRDGRVRVVYGSATLDTATITTITGYNGYGEALGLDLGAVGDLDADGRDDLVVAGGYYQRLFLGTGVDTLKHSLSIGARGVAHDRGRLAPGIPWEILSASPDQYGTGGTPDGVVFVFGLQASSTSLHQHFYGMRSERAGAALAWLGDFDGDGSPDVASSGLGAGAPAGRVTVRGLSGFTLIHPRGVERLAGMTQDSVVWSGTGRAHVEVSANAGRTWTRVATAEAGAPVGRVTWTTPDTNSTGLLARVRSAADSVFLEGRDAVSGYFAVTRASILSPAAGAGGLPGRPLTVRWLASAPVDVESSRDLVRWERLATATGVAGRCSLVLALPDSESTSQYLRIVHTGQVAVTGNSAMAGPLVVKRLAFLAPVGGEQWASGTRHFVRWNAPGPVDIDFTGDVGASWTRLASAVAALAAGTYGGVGSAEITVPVADSSQARFRIALTGEPPSPGNPLESPPVQVRRFEFVDLGVLNWYAGDEGLLSWIGSGEADLDLSADGGVSWTRVLTGASPGPHTLRVPGGMVGAARARLTPTGRAPGPPHSLEYARDITIRRYRLLVDTVPLPWLAGDSLEVNWRGASPADLDLSLDAGRSWWPLARDVGGADDNRLRVALPPQRADSAFVRVSLAGGGAGPGDTVRSARPARIVYHVADLASSPAGQRLALTPLTLRWRGPLPADVALSFDGERWMTIAAAVGGRTLDTVTVTLPDTAGPQARVRVVASGRAVTDTTSVAFTGSFVLRSHLLLAPDGGETWDADSTEEVRFVGRAPADLEFTLDGGRMWQPLATGVGGADTNRVAVVAPALASSRARVRVRRAARAMVECGADTSAATFTIRGVGVSVEPVIASLATLPGEAAGQALGGAVARAGDFDGDGLDDIVVGGGRVLPGGANRARVYVLPGSGGPRRALEGYWGELFGLSVAGVGDFDGDGWDDLAVGAPGYRQIGRVVLYSGGPAADSLEDLSLEAPSPSPAGSGINYGWSMAGVGDMNGDGWSDVVVGSSPSNSTSDGRVGVYFGGPHADGVADVMFQSRRSGYGTCVAAAGDVNGDGFADALVSAPMAAGGDQGVRLYLGGPAVATAPALVITSPNATDLFGFALTGLGDVNGDGYDDFAIGSPYDATAGAFAGRVFVHLGARVPDATPDLVLTGPAAYGYFGSSLAGLRDFDGDGWPDLAVGSARANSVATQAGRVSLFALEPGPLASPLVTVDGTVAYDYFGTSVCSAGDGDGDGREEFAVGAPGRDVPASGCGDVRVYGLSHPRVLSPRSVTTVPAGAAVDVGWSGRHPVDLEFSADDGWHWTALARDAGGADVNGLTVTLPDVVTLDARLRLANHGVYPSPWSVTAVAGPFRIAREMPAAASRVEGGVTHAGGEPRARLGGALAVLGDWDGDGVGEAVVARDPVAPDAPRLMVLRSRAGPLPLAAPGAGPRLGAALGAWDVDGDGAPDVVAGDPRADGARGRVWVWKGGAARDSVPDLVIEAPQAAWGSFGAALAAGDLDGDGGPELVVGAPDDTSDGGAGHVVALRMPGGWPWWTLAGRWRGERFGAALALGDLDGDGAADLAVGCPDAAVPRAGCGRVDVFLRADTRPSRASLTRAGDQFGAAFGAALVVPGDLDGDGRDDLVAGAPRHDGPAGADAGRASVMLGGRPFDLREDLAFDGARAGAWAGAALAGGDLDGDGFADLAVGAPFDGEQGAGSVAVHLGEVIPDASPDAVSAGALAGARLGSALAVRRGADGLADLLVTAPFGGDEAGALHLFDWSRYRVTEPVAGARWLAGSLRPVAWLGAEPARLEVSADGGATWMPLERGVGGADSNAVAVRAPGEPGEYRVRVRPERDGLPGVAESEPFAVDRTVALLALAARATDEGVALDWVTDPAPGPAGVAGYRLYRRAPGMDGDADGERIGPDPITALAYLDPAGVPGSTYALRALDGTGTELQLGAVTVEVAIGGLVAWPVPARRGEPVRLSFVAPTDASGRAPADLEVAVFDVTGRRVATLARGALATTVGRVRLVWAGDAPAGLYFLRVESRSAAFRADRRLVLAR